MKFILFATSFLMITPAFASVPASYTCKSFTSNKGVLRIVGSRLWEPRVDFYPEGDSHTDNSRKRYHSYFSELKVNEKSYLPRYFEIKKVDHFGFFKIVSEVYIEPQVLELPRSLRVMLVKRTLSFSGKLKSLKTQSFNCTLK